MSWMSIARAVKAGRTLHATLDPTVAGRNCVLTASGPYEGQRLTWALKPRGRLVKLSLHTKADATAGRWLIKASCRLPTVSVTRAVVRVLNGRSGHGLLATHRGLRYVRLRPHAQSSRDAPAKTHVRTVRIAIRGGRGGGDPGNDYPAKWRNVRQDSVFDNWGMYNRECVSFVAWALASRNHFNVWPSLGSASSWASRAHRKGYRVDTTPAPGAVAWFSIGHVAYVQQVKGANVYLEEYNWDYTGHYHTRTIPASQVTRFIHFADLTPAAPPPFDPGAYNDHIVQWSGDKKAQKTSWLVTNGHRNWIPDISTYNCLKSAGHPGPDSLSAAQLDKLPDQSGVWAKCSTPSQPVNPQPVNPQPGGGNPQPGGGNPQPNPGPGDTSPPSTPGGLTASGATQSSLNLSWNASTDNVGVTGYDVYLNGGHVATASSTSATVSGLSCSVSYTLGVDAYDAAGNHSGQTSTNASTAACPPTGDTSPPSAPSGLHVTSASQTAIAIAWDASTDNVGVTKYFVLLNGNHIANVTGTSYSYSGLKCGTSYTLGVNAWDGAGNQSGTTSISASTAACPAPSVSASKGAHVTVSGCSSSSCAFVTAHWSNFSSGNHTLVCWGDWQGSSPYAQTTVSGSSGTANYCVFGFVGYHAWVVIDGVSSNKVTW